MFKVKEDKTILLNRGDVGSIKVTAKLMNAEEEHIFKKDDVLRFQVYEKSNTSSIKLRKDVEITEEITNPVIELTSDDTAFDEPKNKPVEYAYEIKLNPDTAQQTLIGHDDNGPKIFRVFPEGSDE